MIMVEQNAGKETKTDEKPPVKPPVKPTTTPKSADKTADKPKTARVRKEYAPLDFTAIKAAPADKDALIRHRQSKGVREGEQLAVDKLVSQAYARWQQSGKPEKWLDCVGTGYTLEMPEKHVETFVYRVRRAAVYYDVAVRFGRTIVEDDGTAKVLFIAKDKKTNDDSEESGDDDSGEE
jgi:hypothetical protein